MFIIQLQFFCVISIISVHWIYFLFTFLQFAGFSPKAVAERMLDASCNLVITAGESVVSLSAAELLHVLLLSVVFVVSQFELSITLHDGACLLICIYTLYFKETRIFIITLADLDEFV